MNDEELPRLAARGLLAGAVAPELSAPLERVARELEAAIERLDGHVAASRGPEPLPYQELGRLRERVAAAFLDVGRVARLAADLAAVIAAPMQRAPEPVDVNELCERALSLARHRFAPDAEVLRDLASLGPIRLDAVRVVQFVTHLLLDAADQAPAGATVLLSTAPDGEGARVTLDYPTAGAARPRFAALLAPGLEAEGARITYSDESGRTLAELTLAPRK